MREWSWPVTPISLNFTFPIWQWDSRENFQKKLVVNPLNNTQKGCGAVVGTLFLALLIALRTGSVAEVWGPKVEARGHQVASRAVPVCSLLHPRYVQIQWPERPPGRSLRLEWGSLVFLPWGLTEISTQPAWQLSSSLRNRPPREGCRESALVGN